MSKKTIIILLTVAIFAVISLLAYSSYKNSLQQVTIDFDNSDNVKLNIYSRKDKDNDPPIKQGEIIRTLSSSETFTLQKGAYVAEPVGTNISERLVAVTVGDTPVQQTVTISYTDEHLEHLLQQERQQIEQVITSEFKNIPSLYTIAPGKLYGKGQWYGTALIYQGPSTDYRDTLHLVAQKVDGNWVVATKQPKISLNVVEDKNIPVYVLRDVNEYQAAPSDPPPAPEPDYIIDYSPGAQ